MSGLDTITAVPQRGGRSGRARVPDGARVSSDSGGVSGDLTALRDARIYEPIRSAIIEQRLPPGTKLGEEALSSVFGVSRTGIREALARLAHEGIVQLHRNRGAYVAQLSAREGRDVFMARRLIEAHVIERVAKGMTPLQRRRLETHLATERTVNERPDRGTAIRLAGEFHVILAELAGNAVLTRFLRELVSRTSLVVALYQGPGSSGCEFEDHRPLLADLVAGRTQDAIDRMLRHLDRIEAGLDLDRGHQKRVDFGEIFGSVAKPRVGQRSSRFSIKKGMKG